MILLYYGKIGDGKTYHVVANEIIPAVKDRRKIYTNIDGLDVRALSHITGVAVGEIDITVWRQKSEILAAMQVAADDSDGITLPIARGALVVIDECQMVWDARDFKNTTKGFLTLLEYHRHYGLDLVFLTQNVKRAENAITRLANYSYQVRNLRILGAANRYIINVRQTPLDTEILERKHGVFDSRIFRCYKSAGVLVVGRASGIVWRNGVLLAAFACFLLAGWKGQGLLRWVRGKPVSVQSRAISTGGASGGASAPSVGAEIAAKAPLPLAGDLSTGESGRDIARRLAAKMRELSEADCIASGGRWVRQYVDYSGLAQDTSYCRRAPAPALAAPVAPAI